jgi:hypothetical protein
VVNPHQSSSSAFQASSPGIESLTWTHFCGKKTNALEFIINWVNDSRTTQNVLWIHDLAGSGKSTIIDDHCRESGNLSTFIFFDRDIAERSNPRDVIRTMAYQLGVFHLDIGEIIASPNFELSIVRFDLKSLRLVTNRCWI